MSQRTSLLMHERFVAYYPSLALLLGNPLRAIVLQALWFERNDQDETVMGYALMTERTGIPERTLRDHLGWLVAQGYLTRRRKSAMEATTVWRVEADRLDPAGSADSIREPDPAGSADSIRDPADSAGSDRQDLPTLQPADPADCSFKKEELGGVVTYSGTEQQQPSTSSEDVKDEAHTPAPEQGTGNAALQRTLPAFARAKLDHLDNTTKWEWMLAWQTITEGVTEQTLWDPMSHLTRYFARCKQLHKEPQPEEWTRWYADDEMKARRELVIEREKNRRDAVESVNPFFQ